MKVNLLLKYLCAHLVIQFETFGKQLLSTEIPLVLVKFGQQSIFTGNSQRTKVLPDTQLQRIVDHLSIYSMHIPIPNVRNY